jgi:hypothetical protein
MSSNSNFENPFASLTQKQSTLTKNGVMEPVESVGS